MQPRDPFPNPIVKAISEGKILGLCAGTKPHRIIGIWAVVVEGRVFVRSYTLKPRSWFKGCRVKKRRDTTTELVPL
jgi:hypothetical protein